MILNFPSSPKNWNSRSWLEIICLAPSITLGRGPSKVLSFTIFRRRPVSILLPSKRIYLNMILRNRPVRILLDRYKAYGLHRLDYAQVTRQIQNDNLRSRFVTERKTHIGIILYLFACLLSIRRRYHAEPRNALCACREKRAGSFSPTGKTSQHSCTCLVKRAGRHYNSHSLSHAPRQSLH